MNQEIFADVIGSVHVTGNLVRIDLMTVQPQIKTDNGQPAAEVTRRIIMPLDGFIRSLAVQEDILRKLVDAGVITKAPAPDDKKAAKK